MIETRNPLIISVLLFSSRLPALALGCLVVVCLALPAYCQPAEPVTDSTPEVSTDNLQMERDLIEQIEETESQLLDAQQELRRLESQLGQTEEELKRQKAREKKLRSDIQAYKKKITGNNRALEIFRYNLQKRFPREKKQLENETAELQLTQQAFDHILSGLVESSLAWSGKGNPMQARRAILARKTLERALPVILSEKVVLQKEQQRIDEEYARIERDIALDKRWIDNRLKRNQTHNKNVDRENERLKEIARQKHEAENEIQRGKDKMEALQTLVAMLQEKLPLLRQGIDYKSFPEQKGKLLRPHTGRLLHAFGPRKHPKFNLTIENAGIDIAAQPGDEVRATSDGWVMFTGELPGYGPLVMLHHGGRYFSIYTPVAPIDLKDQQRVRQGQVIARVVDSQTEGESMLHFEIRHQDKPLNPADWLP